MFFAVIARSERASSDVGCYGRSMRWCAPLAIVALVAAGTSRPVYAARAIDRASMSASANAARATVALREANGTAKLAPRRGIVGRTSVSDRRTDHDEVFLVPRVVAFVAQPVIRRLEPIVDDVRRSEPALIDPIARGPPFVVVPSDSPI